MQFDDSNFSCALASTVFEAGPLAIGSRQTLRSTLDYYSRYYTTISKYYTTTLLLLHYNLGVIISVRVDGNINYRTAEVCVGS